ncbi:hypothetical protein HF086_005619 [Spodoptera exigua]|uniref:FLYWCH-type domain-containing protein n=1 Tax=Spodoptera exigua TaxID=7107 RepID=A0A922MY87_SPOEX|nr:hypothetical protein HF086_005619 [Spodoptera exigua]
MMVLCIPQFVKTLQGATLLLLDGFTYSKNWCMANGCTRYVCSKASAGNCKARVFLNLDNQVSRFLKGHNHERPKYIITRSGHYIKVN